MPDSPPDLRRRGVLAGLTTLVTLVPVVGWALDDPASRVAPHRRWIDAAFAMRRLAESWGDQPYGAVLVLADRLVGEGPSRVVKLGDPDAHAEREAIRDAQRRLGRANLESSVLYSTARPCRRCESAAAEARVARMLYGNDARDAGPPRA